MAESVVGMLMPPPLVGGAISWDCQAEYRETGKGWKCSQVVLLVSRTGMLEGGSGDAKEQKAHHQAGRRTGGDACEARRK